MGNRRTKGTSSNSKSLIRCYVPPEQWGQSTVRVSGRQAHHLVHVLRIMPGEGVVCFDGKGHEARGKVNHVNGRDLTVELVGPHTVQPSPWTLTLGVAIPQRGRLDQIVNQATQLGVHRIVPLLTERAEVRPSSASAGRRQTRLFQIAVEAGKQSEVSYLPIIEPATRWADLVSSFRSYDLVLLAAVEGPHEELPDLFLTRAASRVLLLIGPEGDFSPGEIDTARKVGAHVISLGDTVLRCETAVVVALGLVRFFLRRKGQNL